MVGVASAVRKMTGPGGSGVGVISDDLQTAWTALERAGALCFGRAPDAAASSIEVVTRLRVVAEECPTLGLALLERILINRWLGFVATNIPSSLRERITAGSLNHTAAVWESGHRGLAVRSVPQRECDIGVIGITLDINAPSHFVGISREHRRKMPIAYAVGADRMAVAQSSEVPFGTAAYRLRGCDARLDAESFDYLQPCSLKSVRGWIAERWLLVSATLAGFARRAFNDAVHHCVTRHTFGKLLCQHQAVALRLADIDSELEIIQCMVEELASSRSLRTYEACRVLWKSVERFATSCAVTTVQLRGGRAYVGGDTDKWPTDIFACIVLANAGAGSRPSLP